MADQITIRVQCHACSAVIEGPVRYGAGAAKTTGLSFDFTATGKKRNTQGAIQVTGEAIVICPHCETRNKYNI